MPSSHIVSSPRLKTLETCATATGGAFGCIEEAFEPGRDARHSGFALRFAVIAVLTSGLSLAALYHLGMITVF